MASNSLSDIKLVWGEINFSLLAPMHLSKFGRTVVPPFCSPVTVLQQCKMRGPWALLQTACLSSQDGELRTSGSHRFTIKMIIVRLPHFYFFLWRRKQPIASGIAVEECKRIIWRQRRNTQGSLRPVSRRMHVSLPQSVSKTGRLVKKKTVIKRWRSTEDSKERNCCVLGSNLLWLHMNEETEKQINLQPTNQKTPRKLKKRWLKYERCRSMKYLATLSLGESESKSWKTTSRFVVHVQFLVHMNTMCSLHKPHKLENILRFMLSAMLPLREMQIRLKIRDEMANLGRLWTLLWLSIIIKLIGYKKCHTEAIGILVSLFSLQSIFGLWAKKSRNKAAFFISPGKCGN